MNYANEIEIDLFDLFRSLISKWKILIICLVVGGLLGGTYTYYKTPDSDSIILSDDERTEVETIYNLEKQYLASKVRVSEILENSLKSGISEADSTFILAVNNLYSIIENSKAFFSYGQGLYYNELVFGKTESYENSKSIFLYAAIGAALGVFIGGAVICFAYCFSDKLRTVREMTSYFKLDSLAIIDSKKCSEKTVESLSNDIVLEAKKNNISKVYISVPYSDKAKEIANKIIVSLSKKSVESDIIGFPISFDESDLNNKRIGIVFAEEIGLSRFEQIDDNIKKCNLYDAVSLGCVVIK